VVCEMLKIAHYLDNRLTDGGKVVGWRPDEVNEFFQFT
jgi:hypothetical protein